MKTYKLLLVFIVLLLGSMLINGCYSNKTNMEYVEDARPGEMCYNNILFTTEGEIIIEINDHSLLYGKTSSRVEINEMPTQHEQTNCLPVGTDYAFDRINNILYLRYLTPENCIEPGPNQWVWLKFKTEDSE